MRHKVNVSNVDAKWLITTLNKQDKKFWVQTERVWRGFDPRLDVAWLLLSEEG